jgi:hypothetical protein
MDFTLQPFPFDLERHRFSRNPRRAASELASAAPPLSVRQYIRLGAFGCILLPVTNPPPRSAPGFQLQACTHVIPPPDNMHRLTGKRRRIPGTGCNSAAKLFCLKKRITTGYSQQRINKSDQSSVLMMPASNHNHRHRHAKLNSAPGQHETVEPDENGSSGGSAETGSNQNTNG